MFAWIASLLGLKKKEPLKLDIYTNHFTRPNGQWEDPPKLPEIENRLEKMGERLRTEHPATMANARHSHQRVLEQIAAKEKEVRPTATIFPHRPIVRSGSEIAPEVKRFRDTQAAVDRTRQGMLNNAKRSSTFNPTHSNYNPGNPTYNPSLRDNRRRDDEPVPWYLIDNSNNTPAPAPYYPTNNHSNYDCPAPHHHSHYDNSSNHTASCPTPDPAPVYSPDPAPYDPS